MTTCRQSHPRTAVSTDHEITHTLNGTEMKNLGISSMTLRALFAGVRTLAGRAVTGQGLARTWVGARSQDHPERGDVPGWVMITLMSAVLVAGLLALAGPALETMFNQAMDQVGK